MMKNYIKIIILLLVSSSSISAQKQQQRQQRGLIGDVNWLNTWTEFNPDTVDYNEYTEILMGSISEDMTLYKTHTYLLVGNVFVTNNAILSIEPGTVIKGDFKSKATLTITKGAAIIAEGALTDPIIFTSNNSVKKAGDWGGVIILGDGFTNKQGEILATSFYPEIRTSNYNHTNYGGENLKHNSGYMSYVRVEYAGGKIKKSNETISALLLAGVGEETTINNVMISYSAGNSFNVIGGKVNLDKMISYRAKNIDYNFDYGTKSNINNSLALRSPYVTSDASKCIRAASHISEDVDFSMEGTVVVATNMTLLADADDLDYAINSGLIRESIFVGENTNFKIENSVISSFSKAVLLHENITINDANLSRIQVKNVLFNNFNATVFSKYNNDSNEYLERWYTNPDFSNVYSKTTHSLLFMGLNNSDNRDYRLRFNRTIVMSNSK